MKSETLYLNTKRQIWDERSFFPRSYFNQVPVTIQYNLTQYNPRPMQNFNSTLQLLARVEVQMENK